MSEEKTEEEREKERERERERMEAEQKEKDEKATEVVIALEDNLTDKNGEVTFLKGERISVIEKIDNRRWKGESGAGVGYFDPSKVRPATEEDIAISDSEPYLQLQEEFRRVEEQEAQEHTQNLHHALIVPSKCVTFDDNSPDNFHLINLDQLPEWPLLVFANPKSGGNRGAVLMKYFKRLLNPIQVFDITNGGPERGLTKFESCKKLRVLGCGGDGTIAWILSVLDKLNMSQTTSVAILPLGTGNDLARVLGWGPGYDGGNISQVLSQVEVAYLKLMDRWTIEFVESDGTITKKAMNNYFSIGASAKIAFDFNEKRNNNQKLFSSRVVNKAAYALDGFKDSITRSCKDLDKKLVVSVNGQDILLPGNEEIILLNIPSYGAGMDLWGQPKGNKHRQLEMNDKLFEVLTIEGAFHMGTIKMGIGKANRILQTNNLCIKNKENLELPIQIDGEAEMKTFKEIRVSHLNQVNMLEYKSPPTRFRNFILGLKTKQNEQKAEGAK